MAKYILVEEEADPDGGCEIWLYTNERCEEYCVVAVANSESPEEGNIGGFHVAHTCRPHGEWLIEDLNSRFENLSDEDKKHFADGWLNYPDM